ncbi:hypothetical protein [Janibacter melonis]|uniref:hypothetical protein n=1 Tax=Janibacter melonis TaxID=262209 RepID=UPI00177FFC57|nr:hypothetical protein [Janibacter melonis]
MPHPLDRTRTTPSALASGSCVAPIVVGGLLLLVAVIWGSYAQVTVDDMSTGASQYFGPTMLGLTGVGGLVYGLLVLAAKVQESHALLIELARARDEEADRAEA